MLSPPTDSEVALLSSSQAMPPWPATIALTTER